MSPALHLETLEDLDRRTAIERLDAKKRWWFCKMYVEPHLPRAAKNDLAIALLPNHEAVIARASPTQLSVKSRKIAHSFGFALFALAQAAVRAGSQIVIGSYDETEAKSKITYLEDTYAVLPAGERRELKMSDGSTAKSFANGSEILSIPRKAPTGHNGHFIGDEFSIEPAGKTSSGAILNAALGAITHRGVVRLGGTQRGTDTMFYKLWRREEQEELLSDPAIAALLGPMLQRAAWEILEFPWWSSPALSSDPAQAAIEAPFLNTFDRVQKWGLPILQNEFVHYLTTPELGLNLFQREYELAVLADGDNYYEEELLRECYAARPEEDAGAAGGWERAGSYPFEWCEVDGKELHVAALSRHNPGALRPAFEAIDALAAGVRSGRLPGEWGIGMDVGRHLDLDEIILGHNLPEDPHHLCVRANLTLRDMPFPGKQAVYEYALERLPITQGAIDGTHGSTGVQLAEELARRYGRRAQTYLFTRPAKATWATGLKARMQRRLLTLPWMPSPSAPRREGVYRKLQDQILAVKKLEKGTSVVFDVERTKDGHGDAFWALCLWNDLYGSVPPGRAQDLIVLPRAGGSLSNGGGLGAEKSQHGPGGARGLDRRTGLPRRIIV